MTPRRLLVLLPLLALLAGLVATGPAAAAERTFALDPLQDKLKHRPHKLSFRDVEMTDLRWTRWAKDAARARGISRILTTWGG